jgi:hypothetical protein
MGTFSEIDQGKLENDRVSSVKHKNINEREMRSFLGQWPEIRDESISNQQQRYTSLSFYWPVARKMI